MDIDGPKPLEQSGPRPRDVVRDNVDPPQLARDTIAAHPEFSPDEIADLLEQQGVQVSRVLIATEMTKVRPTK